MTTQNSITIINGLTGETIVREMTAEEIAQSLPEATPLEGTDETTSAD